MITILINDKQYKLMITIQINDKYNITNKLMITILINDNNTN